MLRLGLYLYSYVVLSIVGLLVEGLSVNPFFINFTNKATTTNSSTSLPITTTSEETSKNSQLTINPAATEFASILSDYMVKSHEEKLSSANQIKEMQAEIHALKSELLELKSSKASSSPSTYYAENKSNTEKVAAYVEFISKYLVQAQEEKMKAVKAAEEKTRKAVEEEFNTKLASPNK